MLSVIKLSVDYAECHKYAHYAECHKYAHYADCHMLSYVMLNAIMLSVVMLIVLASRNLFQKILKIAAKSFISDQGQHSQNLFAKNLSYN